MAVLPTLGLSPEESFQWVNTDTGLTDPTRGSMLKAGYTAEYVFLRVLDFTLDVGLMYILIF